MTVVETEKHGWGIGKPPCLTLEALRCVAEIARDSKTPIAEREARFKKYLEAFDKIDTSVAKARKTRRAK